MNSQFSALYVVCKHAHIIYIRYIWYIESELRYHITSHHHHHRRHPIKAKRIRERDGERESERKRKAEKRCENERQRERTVKREFHRNWDKRCSDIGVIALYAAYVFKRDPQL